MAQALERSQMVAMRGAGTHVCACERGGGLLDVGGCLGGGVNRDTGLATAHSRRGGWVGDMTATTSSQHQLRVAHASSAALCSCVPDGAGSQVQVFEVLLPVF
jgi:hypothetical protein